MRTKLSLGGLVALLAAIVLAQVGLTQVTEAPSADSPANVAQKPRGRLPNYYGQVGVSDEQKEAIYALQTKYEKQIDSLRMQIAKLESQRDMEIEAVLTPTQKELYEQLVKQAEERRKARAKIRAERRGASRSEPPGNE